MRTSVACLLATLLLAACTDGPAAPPAATGGTAVGAPTGGAGTAEGTPATDAAPSGAPSVGASSAPSGEGGPSGGAEPSPAPSADDGDGGATGLDAPPTGSTGPVSAPAEGGPTLFVAVRVAAQDGFDRVVLEYAGDGVPGYEFRYVAEHSEQGSGEPVDLPGDTGLSGFLGPVDWTAPGNYTGPRRLEAPGTRSVTVVDTGILFEADHDPYIGVTEEKPYRVTVLRDPTRVVVDVAH